MKEPLAQRLRPRTLDEVCGQRHLLAPGQVFRTAVNRQMAYGEVPVPDGAEVGILPPVTGG